MSNARQAKQINKNHKSVACGGWSARTLMEAGDIPIAQIAELD